MVCNSQLTDKGEQTKYEKSFTDNAQHDHPKTMLHRACVGEAAGCVKLLTQIPLSNYN